MSPSSPYATFRADAWMRGPAIAIPAPCAAKPGSITPKRRTPSASTGMKKAFRKTRTSLWIQGDLFQASLPC